MIESGRIGVCLMAGAALAGPAMVFGQSASEDRSAPVDLLTLARGAVLVEATHNPGAALALTDGDGASTWSTPTKKTPPPYGFVFELMAPAELTAVGVAGAGQRPGGVAGGSARTIIVEGSTEGRDGPYLPLAELVADAEGTTLAEPSSAIPIRFLRFTIRDAHAAEAPFLYLAEVIAHGGMPIPEAKDRFTGIYQTGRATTLELKQEGTTLTGCYTDNAGRTFGSLNGTVSDGVALLAWRSDQGITGTALLTIDSEGALRGVRYRHRSRTPWGGPPAAEGTSTPCSEERTPANPIAEALENEGEAKIYGILFNHDSDVPRSISEPALRQLHQALERNPGMKVVVEGHTDADGTHDYNLDLSARRAASVVSWLIERGIAAERLTAEGKGESEPVASNDTADGKALNRRVEVVVAG